MNTNFNLLNMVTKTNQYVDKLIVNFPKREVVLKNRLENCMFSLVELIFSYEIQNVSRIKEKYLKDMLIQLSMFNYYINFSYERKYISKRQSHVVGRYLVEIRKMIYGVIRSEKNKV